MKKCLLKLSRCDILIMQSGKQAVVSLNTSKRISTNEWSGWNKHSQIASDIDVYISVTLLLAG